MKIHIDKTCMIILRKIRVIALIKGFEICSMKYYNSLSILIIIATFNNNDVEYYTILYE